MHLYVCLGSCWGKTKSWTQKIIPSYVAIGHQDIHECQKLTPMAVFLSMQAPDSPSQLSRQVTASAQNLKTHNEQNAMLAPNQYVLSFASLVCQKMNAGSVMSISFIDSGPRERHRHSTESWYPRQSTFVPNDWLGIKDIKDGTWTCNLDQKRI